MRNVIIAFIIGVVATAVFVSPIQRYFIEQKLNAKMAVSAQEQQTASVDKKKVEKFVRQGIHVVDSWYDLGVSKFEEGKKETNFVEDNENFVRIVEVSPKIFEANEYFFKVKDLVVDMRRTYDSDNANDITDMIDSSWRKMVESISLYGKACSVQEQIGRTLSANKLAAYYQGEMLEIPEYSAELEKSQGKQNAANAYLCSALWKLKELVDEADLDAVYSAKIAYYIGQYAEASEKDVEEYIQKAEEYFAEENYFNTIILLEKAIRFKKIDNSLGVVLAAAYGKSGWGKHEQDLKAVISALSSEKE